MEKLKIYKNIKEVANTDDYLKREKLLQNLKIDLYLNNSKEDIKEVKDIISIKIENIKEKIDEEIKVCLRDYKKSGDEKYLEKITDVKYKDEKEKMQLWICEKLMDDYRKYVEVVLPKEMRVHHGNCKNEKGNTLKKDRLLEEDKKMIIINSFFNVNPFNHGEAYILLDPKTNYTYRVLRKDLYEKQSLKN
jgi:hypothetical protein